MGDEQEKKEQKNKEREKMGKEEREKIEKEERDQKDRDRKEKEDREQKEREHTALYAKLVKGDVMPKQVYLVFNCEKVCLRCC
jgi:hypothetical protein